MWWDLLDAGDPDQIVFDGAIDQALASDITDVVADLVPDDVTSEVPGLTDMDLFAVGGDHDHPAGGDHGDLADLFGLAQTAGEQGHDGGIGDDHAMSHHDLTDLLGGGHDSQLPQTGDGGDDWWFGLGNGDHHS